MDERLQHLRILSIFHYVVGGLAALFACIPLIHFSLGLGMTAGWFPPEGSGEPIPRFIGILLMVFAGGAVLLGWIFALCTILAGWYLAERRHYTYCLVMAGVECIFMPFGTVLGVFTIVLLSRPAVRSLFEGEPPPSGN